MLLVSLLGHAQRVGSASNIPVRASTRLRLLAEVEPANAKAGEPIFLKLRTKNISSKTVGMADTGYNDYDLTLADGSGKEPPLTKFGVDLRENAILLRSVSLDLEPGEEASVTLEITKIYRLAPGTYYLRASRHTINPESREEFGRVDERAFSNPVMFTVLP